ncbi:MAG: alginate biosynthesis protein AlgX [Porticoccaceae bacterium]
MTSHVNMNISRLIACLAVGLSVALPVTADETPHYAVELCCKLCPETQDPKAYNTPELVRNRQLIDGQDGWLYRSNFDLNTDFSPRHPNAYGDLRRFAEALRSRGTELVLVYLPTRGLMHPDSLTPDQRTRYDHQAAALSYAAQLNAFRDQGVQVPDLTPLLRDPPQQDAYYFKRDRHWTPAGAKRTAQLVAETVRRLPGYAEFSKQTFTTVHVGMLRKNGSLQQAVAQVCGFQYSDQWVPAFRTEAGASAYAAPPITLVGTSFSAEPGSYNFRGYLQEYLGVEIHNASVPDHGAEGSWLNYLASTEFQHAPPPVLLWEVPAHGAPGAGKFYRQAVPLVNDGCERSVPVLARKVTLKPGATEVLFNDSGKALEIDRRLVLDLRLSDSDPRNLAANIWSTTGGKTTLALKHHNLPNTQGRFVVELGAGSASRELHFLSMDIVLPPNAPAGTTVDARLCAPATGTRQHVSTQ